MAPRPGGAPVLPVRYLTQLLLSFFLAGAIPWQVSAAGDGLRSDNGELVLTLKDGRALRRDALVGLTLVSGPGRAEIRIDGVNEDRKAAWGPMPLYLLSVRDHKTQQIRNLCEPDPSGRRAAIAVPDGAGGFSFTCTSGAEGKCILMGYRPWKFREGLPLRDLYRACVHMLRADYGGDGNPATRNGTPVNIWDRFGVQLADMADGMQFEAAWGPDGAICVAHTRIPELVSLQNLAARYPRLVSHLGPNSCIDEVVGADPRAILFNRSTVKAPPG